ncbi:hypothetical protein G7075_14465 [Phycicoccus sp. HDW14]|uniref:hypothetical protein n=1 Tax=Phycicoccus sp. HDW14 TaxID=2714941 RepID=UPI0014089C23|nr:hypothetical protein [Phycicoccus sp. HDW14]QIM22054.1 hypothetical protein G7075_14465 [Phycicoccus sp. HDW14]
MSRSSTHGRAVALQLAAQMAAHSRKPLVIVDSPAVHDHLRREVPRHCGSTTWRILEPDELSVTVLSLRGCLVLANYAVASAWTPDGRALSRLIGSPQAVLLTLHPRDLALDPELRTSLGRNVIDTDAPVLNRSHG